MCTILGGHCHYDLYVNLESLNEKLRGMLRAIVLEHLFGFHKIFHRDT